MRKLQEMPGELLSGLRADVRQFHVTMLEDNLGHAVIVGHREEGGDPAARGAPQVSAEIAHVQAPPVPGHRDPAAGTAVHMAGAPGVLVLLRTPCWARP